MTRDKHYTDEIWANIGPGLGPEQEYYFEPRSGYTKYIKAERYDQLKMDCMKLIEALEQSADPLQFVPKDVLWELQRRQLIVKEALDQFKAKYQQLQDKQ